MRTSSIVKVSFDSPDPQPAPRRSPTPSPTNYITANLDRRFDASSYARTFLEERLQQLKVKLEESEKELVAYAEQQHIVGSGDSQNLSMTNLTAANDALTKATSDRLRAELLWQQVQAATGLGLPQFLENAVDQRPARQARRPRGRVQGQAQLLQAGLSGNEEAQGADRRTRPADRRPRSR